MQRLKQYALGFDFCASEENRNSMGSTLSINNNYDQFRSNIISHHPSAPNSIADIHLLIIFAFGELQLLIWIISPVQNQLYLSTMHPSRIAALIAKATARCFPHNLLKNTSFPRWGSQRAGYSLNSQIKYCFSSEPAGQPLQQKPAGQPLQQELAESREFAEFVTDKGILSRLQQHGITKMFPVQEETFRLIEAGKDVLASDRTGSGKTLGYTLPVLQKFNKAKYNLINIKAPKFLILCPTRELVLQVTSQINKFNSVYKVVAVYGGAPIEKQTTEISRGVAIIVATPGRLIDLMERKAINLRDLQVVCIDEADTMLQKGFKDDVEQIFNYVRGAAGKTQNIMFSATIPNWVVKIAREYFDKDMQRVNMIKEDANRTSQTVEHLALYVKRHQRLKTIRSLISKYNPNNRTIIFTQTKAEANDFMSEFESKNIVILHGDIPQGTREHNMRDFRNGHKKILIATDVAARGIDIPDVQLVIQLSPPENPQPYIHRSGRTGRAGKEGTNITFFDETNVSDLLEIEKAANIKINIISNSYGISYWQTKLKKVITKITELQSSKNEEIYEHFIKDLLSKTTPESAILYLLKQHMGPQPEVTSVLTNRKGYVTYKAHPIHQDKPAKLSEVFKDVTIHAETRDQEGIKFDISISQFYQFEELINKQEYFEVESLDQNSKMTLSSFANRLSRKGGNMRNDRRRYQRDSEEEWHDRRDRTDSRMRERRNRPDRQEHHQKRNPHANLPPEGLSNYQVFLFGFSPEVNEREMKDEIVNQTELTGFKLRLLKKQDESGNTKTFGFIEFNNRDDCVTFLESNISVNGETLRKRLAENKQ